MHISEFIDRKKDPRSWVRSFAIIRFYSSQIPDFPFSDDPYEYEVSIRKYDWIPPERWRCFQGMTLAICAEPGAEEAMRENQEAIISARPKIAAFLYPDKAVHLIGGQIHEYIYQPVS